MIRISLKTLLPISLACHALFEWDETMAFIASSKHVIRTDTPQIRLPIPLAAFEGSGDIACFPANSTGHSTDGGLALRSPGEAIKRLGLSTGPTVWTEFSRLAQENNPVNL